MEENEIVNGQGSEVNNQSKEGIKLGAGTIMILLVVAAIAGVTFLKKPAKVESEPMTTPTPQVAAEMTTAPADIRVVSVEAGSFYYKPDVITVKKGEKVRLELKSVDMMHDFNVDELGIKVPVTKSGDTGIVEFTANEVGEFETYCSVGQHRANGQVGKLIVTE